MCAKIVYGLLGLSILLLEMPIFAAQKTCSTELEKTPIATSLNEKKEISGKLFDKLYKIGFENDQWYSVYAKLEVIKSPEFTTEVLYFVREAGLSEKLPQELLHKLRADPQRHAAILAAD
ncbi:MAG: hypothetical protein KDD40_07255, partial [Bdellovibrionales bacterium]|nr:hypothetical protein [Bdellovibrionales bacterium]